MFFSLINRLHYGETNAFVKKLVTNKLLLGYKLFSVLNIKLYTIHHFYLDIKSQVGSIGQHLVAYI